MQGRVYGSGESRQRIAQRQRPGVQPDQQARVEGGVVRTSAAQPLRSPAGPCGRSWLTVCLAGSFASSVVIRNTTGRSGVMMTYWYRRLVALSRNFALGLVLAGLVIGVLGFHFLLDSRRFYARATATADGVVVDVVESNSGENTAYFPVVRFVTPFEQTVEFKSDSTDRDYQLGDSVRVRYDPRNPQDARLDTWLEQGGFGATLMLIGFFALIGGVVWWYFRRARRHVGAHEIPQL